MCLWEAKCAFYNGGPRHFCVFGIQNVRFTTGALGIFVFLGGVPGKPFCFMESPVWDHFGLQGGCGALRTGKPYFRGVSQEGRFCFTESPVWDNFVLQGGSGALRTGTPYFRAVSREGHFAFLESPVWDHFGFQGGSGALETGNLYFRAVSQEGRFCFMESPVWDHLGLQGGSGALRTGKPYFTVSQEGPRHFCVFGIQNVRFTTGALGIFVSLGSKMCVLQRGP